MGSLGVGHDWETSLSLSCIGEGNDNPLQCSCLENPRDGGAWWAAVSGVAQSRTRLKRLSSSSSKFLVNWVSTLCDSMDCSTPGFPVLHYLREFAQTHIHWISDAIQSSHPFITFSSCLQSFPESESFSVSWLFTSGGQSIRASALASVLPMNIQG